MSSDKYNGVIVHGERNSCNTYLVKMVERHFGIPARKTHGDPEYHPGHVHLISTKNPYAWILSLWRKPHGPRNFRKRYDRMTLGTFLRAPWKEWPNALQRYNYIYGKYWEFFLTSDVKPLILRSEDLQRDPKNMMEALAGHFDLEMGPFRNIAREVNSAGQLGKPFKRTQYYLTEGWKNDLTLNQAKYITDQIDSSIWPRFGYDPLCT